MGQLANRQSPLRSTLRYESVAMLLSGSLEVVSNPTIL